MSLALPRQKPSQEWLSRDDVLPERSLRLDCYSQTRFLCLCLSLVMFILYPARQSLMIMHM